MHDDFLCVLIEFGDLVIEFGSFVYDRFGSGEIDKAHGYCLKIEIRTEDENVIKRYMFTQYKITKINKDEIKNKKPRMFWAKKEACWLRC